MNEAFKKQLLSSHDFFQARRWEGKPWSFKFKFAYANYPEILVSTLFLFFVAPAICAYKYYSFPNSRREAISKYRSSYTVVRDDHPNIENIKAEKERGREFFPEY